MANTHKHIYQHAVSIALLCQAAINLILSSGQPAPNCVPYILRQIIPEVHQYWKVQRYFLRSNDSH